ASQESRVQTDLDQVRKQIFDMQKDTAAMVTKMSAVEAKLGSQEATTPARWAELQALLQTLTDEGRTLGPRLDDNTARMGSLARDIAATRDQYRALDARIAAALGQKGPAPPPSALEPPPPPPEKTGTGTAPQGAASTASPSSNGAP